MTAAVPAPNYDITSSPGDLAELTDGHLNRFPFWTRPESVGWVNRTPVALMVALPGDESGRHSLSMRTGMQASADVYPPRRVDIYCQGESASTWRHVGASVHDRNPSEDGKVVDLELLIYPCRSSVIQLIVHADGPYVMIDEISLRKQTGPEDGDKAVEVTGVPLSDPLTDSRRRLEQSLQDAALGRLKLGVLGLGLQGPHAWLQRPWQVLGPAPAQSRQDSLSLAVLPGAEVAYVVALANPRPESHRYMVRGLSLAAEVSWLRPILAADGHLAFDAIVGPLDGSINVEGGGVEFVLVQQPAVQAGTTQVAVTDETGWSQALRVDLTLLDRIRPEVADQPRVLVWTYTNDQPIWQPDNAPSIAAELVAAGVNVFDLHPQHIPAPLGEPAWPVRVQALRSDLALFRGKGLVLLFIGPDAWATLTSLPDDAQSRRRLEKWVSLIATTMQAGGFDRDEWALYLVDEPRGDDLDRLAAVITRLRAIDPRLRFYANPSLGRGETVLAAPSLWKLRGLVDYWQPRAGPSFDAVATVVGPRQPTLWVYDNPIEPAKAMPPYCYRALGRQAFNMGASGMGFWSFSDTQGTSAWSDFDGQQPDWAVVYESSVGFVSGRRWEAFKRGIGDYAALGYCARRQSKEAGLRSQCNVLTREIDAETAGACGS